MSKPTITDPHTLANVIVAHGGEIVPAPTLQFKVPRAEVRPVVEAVNQLGVGCRTVREYNEDDPLRLRCTRTVMVIEVHKRPQEKSDDRVLESHLVNMINR
jgi:hypothetical protein